MNLEIVKNHLADSLSKIESAKNLQELDDIRIKYLGKLGIITLLTKEIAKIPIDQKKEFGQLVNECKKQIQDNIVIKKENIELDELEKKLASEKIDLTLPGRSEYIGKIHPLSQAIDEIVEIFSNMGFIVADGPHIEDDFHNFTALNIPEIHPARQMHDTFYLPKKNDQDILLRTHTSSVQIRTMKANKPPFKFISPGRTYRCDWDMTHTPMFHQIEGVLIDKNIHMGHLKGCIEEFLKIFFELSNIPIRLRPSYFPFTEPSAEVDIGCKWNKNELIIGGDSKWLEILGCGMVHPNVLAAVNIDPEEYQGFAFGMGIERLAMLKYGIGDLRNFFDNDARWLKHYGYKAFDIPSLITGLSR